MRAKIPNSYFIYNHQHKGDAYEDVLTKELGLQRADPFRAGIVFTDADTPGRMNRLRRFVATKKMLCFVYPHAARPYVGWDGLFPSWSGTSASFVAAEGHIEVIRAYGYRKPLHVAGWSYSPVRDFVPVNNPRKILFGPIHPTKNGYLSRLDQRINAAAFGRLLDLVDQDCIDLTVRYVRGHLDLQGLWEDPRVRYVQGDVDLTYKDIEEADLVVSHQTFAYIAVALGKPTLMMAEHEAPRNGGNDDDFKRVNSWDKYAHLLMYPLDILNTNDPWGLIKEACASDEKVLDWKCRMIGRPFDPQEVAKVIRSYM